MSNKVLNMPEPYDVAGIREWMAKVTAACYAQMDWNHSQEIVNRMLLNELTNIPVGLSELVTALEQLKESA